MAKKLAFMTIGILHEPVGHPRVQGFIDRISGVYAAADGSEGFVDRSERNVDTWMQTWGPIAAPRCFDTPDDSPHLATTLSLWDDLESVAAFAYHGAHGEAMAKRREWFEKRDAPTYVAWWIEEGDPIDWRLACDRLDHLHENGPTASAFNFTRPFDREGDPRQLAAAEVREKIARNIVS